VLRGGLKKGNPPPLGWNQKSGVKDAFRVVPQRKTRPQTEGAFNSFLSTRTPGDSRKKGPRSAQKAESRRPKDGVEDREEKTRCLRTVGRLEPSGLRKRYEGDTGRYYCSIFVGHLRVPNIGERRGLLSGGCFGWTS